MTWTNPMNVVTTLSEDEIKHAPAFICPAYRVHDFNAAFTTLISRNTAPLFRIELYLLGSNFIY